MSFIYQYCFQIRYTEELHDKQIPQDNPSPQIIKQFIRLENYFYRLSQKLRTDKLTNVIYNINCRNMQNKNKNKLIKKQKKGNKKSRQPQKFSKNEPAPQSAPTTEQKKKIVTSNDKITKTINKNIEKVMMERASTAKEKFRFLKS